MSKEKTYVKKELVGLLQGLIQVEELKGVKFAMVATKNRTIIAELLKEVEAKAEPTDAFKVLSQEMQRYDMDADIEKVKAKEAEPKNAKIIEVRKKQMEEVEKMLEESVKAKLVTLTEDNLPLDINTKQLDAIKLILE